MKLVLYPYQTKIGDLELAPIELEDLIVSDVQLSSQRTHTPMMSFHGTYFETSVAPTPKFMMLVGSYPITKDKTAGALARLLDLLFQPGLRNLLCYYYVVLDRPRGVSEKGVVRNITVNWTATNATFVQLTIGVVVDAESTGLIKLPPSETSQEVPVFKSFVSNAETGSWLTVENHESKRIYVSDVSFAVDLNTFVTPTNWRTYIHTFNVEPLTIGIGGYMKTADALELERLFTLEREYKFTLTVPPIVITARQTSFSHSQTATMKDMSMVSMDGYVSRISQTG